MSDENPEHNDYEVGYKKPPKSGQFQPGQSGNPRGGSKTVRAAKRRSKAFNDLFRHGLQQMVEIEENGRKVSMPRLQLGIRRRAELAATGNLRALKELLKLRDVKEGGPMSPGKLFVFTLDELRCAGPLGVRLYDPNVIILRDPKPVEPGAAKPIRKTPAVQPYRSAKELVEIELERQIWATDAASGDRKRMTMREAIAEQLMRLFTAGKPGTNDLMIKLNQKAEVDRESFKKIYVGVPWDFEMPPRLPKDWQERRLDPRWPLPKDQKPAGS
jgi:hypothetical protein